MKSAVIGRAGISKFCLPILLETHVSIDALRDPVALSTTESAPPVNSAHVALKMSEIILNEVQEGCRAILHFVTGTKLALYVNHRTQASDAS